MPGRGRWFRWALLVLAPLQIFWAMTRSFDTYDEMWFLQVARRLVEGETLYRDVYFNTTPLSMYVTAGVVAVTGAQLLVVKLVTAFSVLASLFLAWKIIDRFVPSDRSVPLLLIALLLVYGNYPSVTPYTPLAVALYLLALLGFTKWLNEGRAGTLFWCGIAAGLCFAAKHNVGVLALGATALAVVTTTYANRRPVASALRGLSLLTAGFTVIVAMMLTIIAATGGWQGFIEYAFRNKPTYIAVGSASYVDGWRLLIETAREPLSWSALMHIYRLFILAVPPLAVALTVRSLVARSGEERIRAAALAVFLLAGLAVTFPRGGASMPYAIPILGLSMTVAWRMGGAPGGRPFRLACAATAAMWLGFALSVMVVNPVRRLASDEWRFSTIPHCRGILVPAATDDALVREAAELRAAIPDGEAFIQTLTAGFYYLAAGIRNPTPYDMPAVTTFGPRGQQKVIAWIAAGRIDEVAVFPHLQKPQIPLELMHAIPTMMRPSVRSDSFTLFVRHAKSEEHGR